MDARIRVLVVDDNTSIRMELISLLKRETRFNLIEGGASNGEEAIKLCGEFDPDVILMDLIMPIMDGISATCIIHDFYPNVQILVFSNAHAGMIEDALAAGATDWLSKVTTPISLVNKIQMMYDQARLFQDS